MTFDDLPSMLLERVERSERLTLYGRFDRLDGVHASGYFRLARYQYAWATLEFLDRAASTVRCTDERDPDIANLRVGEHYIWIYGYWDAPMVEAIADPAHGWRQFTFEPYDAIHTSHEGVRTVIPGGWDHEHCDLCGAHIDVKRPVAYVDDDEWFLCTTCYEAYATTHDLSFLIAS